MIGDTDFLSDLERKIKSCKEAILNFRVITEVADPDDQNANYPVIEDLVAKEKAVLEKITEFKASNAVDRTNLQKQLDELTQSLEDAINLARTKIN